MTPLLTDAEFVRDVARVLDEHVEASREDEAGSQVKDIAWEGTTLTVTFHPDEVHRLYAEHRWPQDGDRIVLTTYNERDNPRVGVVCPHDDPGYAFRLENVEIRTVYEIPLWVAQHPHTSWRFFDG